MCGKYVEEQDVTPFGRELQADAVAEEGPASHVIDLMAALKASLGKRDARFGTSGPVETTERYRALFPRNQVLTALPDRSGGVPSTVVLGVSSADSRVGVAGLLSFLIDRSDLMVDSAIDLEQAELLYSKIGSWIESQRGAPVGV